MNFGILILKLFIIFIVVLIFMYRYFSDSFRKSIKYGILMFITIFLLQELICYSIALMCGNISVVTESSTEKIYSIIDDNKIDHDNSVLFNKVSEKLFVRYATKDNSTLKINELELTNNVNFIELSDETHPYIEKVNVYKKIIVSDKFKSVSLISYIKDKIKFDNNGILQYIEYNFYLPKQCFNYEFNIDMK